MKKSEKKLGIVMETIRYNFQSSKIVGGVEVFDDNNQKRRYRFVSVGKENDLVIWSSFDYDISISSNDIVFCKVVEFGKRSSHMSASSDGSRWYGPVFELTLTNGDKIRLVINEFCVESGEYRDASVADIPHVEGWLASDGTRDEHYNDALCPEGYTPNITGWFKQKSAYSSFKRIDKILNLTNRFPENFDMDGKPKGIYIFDGKKSTYYVKN